MSGAAIISIVIAVVVIVVLAAFLIALAVILQRVDTRVRDVIASTRQIGYRAEPLAPAIESLSIELDQLRTSLERFRFARPER